MAINKRKVLDAARKYAQKGAKGKALKEYHNLLRRDPGDAKLRLEIGDCYRRWGQIDEAITQYSRVAEQYKDDGFDARAVAVFKQILNLDSKRYGAYVSLSELYQRMGLDSEALSALQTAADAHHKEGNKREALELLRKMATLDPTNTTSRLKVAELLRQEGLEDDAVAEYQLVVSELERQGASESIIGVEERILELQPDRLEVLISVGRRLIALGKPEEAEPFVKRALEKDGEDSDAYEVLIEVHKALDNEEEVATATQALAKIFRDRGDEEQARELTQRSSPAVEFEAADPTEMGDASETIDTSEEFPIAEDEEIELDLVSEAEPEELVLDQADEPEIDLSQDEGGEEEIADPPSESLLEGDTDQLLAEANVYLRYGKREEAIESLEAILVLEPNQRAALEKLGEAHAEGGNSDKAVELWSLAATCARAEEDEDGFSVLRDRISSLDADAAFALDQAGPEAVVDEEPEFSAEDEIEFEIDLADDQMDSGASSGDESALDLSVVEDADDKDAEQGIEIDLSPAAADGFEEASPGLDAEQAEEASSLIDESEARAPSVGHSSATASPQVSEDLEEAEFYYQQELFDEAEAVYRRILKLAPNHSSALLRLGEIAAARGDDPSIVSSDEVEESEFSLVEGATAAVDDHESRAHPDAPVSGGFSCAEDTVPIAEDVEAMEVETVEEPEVEEPLAAEAAEEGGFDLAAELRDVIEEVEEAASTDSGVLSTVEEGFESILADFKQGVTATLSEDDYETRYDLGIAYREMELYDDAIGEFHVCLASESHRVASLHMMGLCALDLGRSADATNHLEQALATPDLSDEQVTGLRFDLGRAFEAAGDMARARSTYEAVLEGDPDFPGVAKSLESLGETADAEASVRLQDGESESFESFDDIITDAEPKKAENKKKSTRKKISFV